MTSTAKPRRIAKYAMATSALSLACGIAFAAATPAAAAAETSTTVTTAVRTPVLAEGWEFHGFFPDPITCLLAGNSLGYPFTCNFIVVGWTLWVLIP
jgi:hypothetical protein